MQACKAPGCDAGMWRHGLCRDHWMANARGEDIGLPQPKPPAWAGGQRVTAPVTTPPIRTTVTAPAPKPAPKPRGTGRPTGRPRTNFTCSVAGCDRPATGRGMCNTHRMAERRAAASANRPRCSVPGCEEPVRRRGRCNRHYQQELRAPHDFGRLPVWVEEEEARIAPPPVVPSRLEMAALRLVWAQVPVCGRPVREVAERAGIGLGLTLEALAVLSGVYEYVAFDGEYWRAVVPCAQQGDSDAS